MENKRIVILAGRGISSNIVFNYLKDKFNIEKVLVEDEVDTKIFLKRRVKKLGIFVVLGQILFQFFVVKILDKLSIKRKKEILKINELNDKEIPISSKIEVSSVNSKKTIELLKKINPDLIIVNGTRIISEEVLSSVGCRFINIHAGITPKYRGVHGAYWALVNKDKENNGVTVHFVDKGIDTGEIIFQENIEITKKDNFVTYPFLQLSKGVILLSKAVEDLFLNNLKEKKERKTESYLWSHPTIWQYIYHRVFKGVK